MYRPAKVLHENTAKHSYNTAKHSEKLRNNCKLLKIIETMRKQCENEPDHKSENLFKHTKNVIRRVPAALELIHTHMHTIYGIKKKKKKVSGCVLSRSLGVHC